MLLFELKESALGREVHIPEQNIRALTRIARPKRLRAKQQLTNPRLLELQQLPSLSLSLSRASKFRLAFRDDRGRENIISLRNIGRSHFRIFDRLYCAREEKER